MPQSKPDAILVVHDEMLSRELLGDALAQQGFTVFLGSGACVALEILRTRPMDLVITDYRLPGMRGDALLSRVKAGHPGVWRALVAGYSDLEPVLGCLEEGIAHHYFSKTAEPAVVAAAVSSILAARPEPVFADQAPRRILLVEDSDRRRRHLAALLAPFGAVTAVSNGPAALRSAIADRPDLVITGLDLHGISGLDLIRFLKVGLGCAVPVIVWEEKSLLDQPMAAGIRDEARQVVERDDDRPDTLVAEVRRLVVRPAPHPRKRK
jgi:CheY-like chemotaxis protein